jgi:GrpB-like predicted nucleotidyltransferase (UPF0157 family)
MAKLKLSQYSEKSPKIFEKIKKKISEAISSKDIHHIGSTAVPGLGGKGIIDIMIEIKSWEEAKDIVKKLKKIGFRHVHPKERGRIFLSKHREPTPDNVHLHITKKGSKQYKELLAFRDYLKRNKKEAKRYFELKLDWLKKVKSNRAKYTILKEKYVKEILNRVKIK